MKNNIIKDDREITMKAESLSTDVLTDAESITTVDVASPLEHHNLSTEASELNTETHEANEMNTETLETDGIKVEALETDGINTETPIDISDPTEPMMIADEPMIEPAAVDGQSIQAEITAFVENATASTTELFNNNRQLFITFGWIVLAIFGAKVVFATLGIIDDIPLVTPIIKLVGLVSVVRFATRYLIRKQDRQELIEIIDQTKVSVLGDR
jgi:CAAD domains of cyanobacterial aminoacyl-tRNA synthetase